MALNRRDFALALAGVASAAALVKPAQAQQFGGVFGSYPALTPNIDELSPSVKEQLGKILIDQALKPIPQLGMLAQEGGDGPNPDPEYSEFWVQVVPKPDALVIDTQDAGQQFFEREFWRNNPQVAGEMNFGEDAFFEITPEWSQMCSPDGCDGGTELNTIVTIRAVDGGAPITDASFYQDILKAMGTKRP